MIKKEYINIANILTFSRIILGLVFLALFLFQFEAEVFSGFILKIISFFVFVIAIITDGLDGYFARKNDKVTDFGKHFDPLSDSIFFIIVFLTFVIINLMPVYFFIIIFFREAFMHLFLRPYVKKKGSSLPASIFGKIKTVCQSVFSLIILFALILNDFLNYISKNISFLKNLIIQTSFVLFLIIALLSLFSLTTYLINLGKIIPKQK
ncbi:MAG: CDP-diacylglycerol--glycerol-3-phosphate 3-phosphatidyltransferase [Spirochaetes bacterium GWD1_27_9]|nr:MAG: CDP-diacylglycerol--glycerol-3-phosphate 3-phosphatidyltransferase [Spirochaetes bacterium GWC1_27_15]OHD44883.1 MAG: CDP-diacylglycerol--glycerol-3-phosphate 3-phosphatidyltransferase [Spirochaetes bacterium GWD1_27_9]